MTGLPKRRLIEDLEHGFPTLPPGCTSERIALSIASPASGCWRA